MNKSTLIHAISGENCISLRTISRSGKSPHWFYILRNELEELEHKTELVVSDIHSFAILRRDPCTNIIEIEFTWLGGDGHSVSGYQESVAMPYDSFLAFVRDSAFKDGPKELKTLSIDISRKYPKIVFKGRENLHAVMGNGIVKRKLVRFLRDQFNWNRTEKIEFYNDCTPYSFVFREIREGKTVMTGGLILHGQEDMEKSYYGIHT